MPNWKTGKFILFDTYLISYTKFRKYHFGVLEYLQPEGANCRQNLRLGGQCPLCPHCSWVGGLNKKLLPSKLQYLLACDNIAKKLGGCIVITNCNKSLLQITTAKLLQITTKFYYKLRQLIYYKLRQFYYKLRQLLQIATNLLQITTAITNCDNYYKLRRNNCNKSLVNLIRGN